MGLGSKRQGEIKGEEMSTELELLEQITEDKYPVIYGKGGLDQFYDAVKQKVSEEIADLSTKKGRDRIASLAAKVSSSKVAVEKPGREYLKQLKDMPKKIEAELREFIDKMDKLRDETRKPLTDWENAEKARVQAHQDKISFIKRLSTELDCAKSHDITALLEATDRVVIDESLEEFQGEAATALMATQKALREALDKRLKYEAEQAELARLRAEAEERARKDREEQIARTAAEQAKRIAEQAAQIDKERAEAAAKAERDAAEKRELELKLAAEQAERQRVQAEQAQKAAEEAKVKAEADAKAQAEQAARDAEERVKREAEAKAQAEAAELAKSEADKKHKARINNESMAALVANGFSDEDAKKIVVLIASGKVPNVKINY